MKTGKIEAALSTLAECSNNTKDQDAAISKFKAARSRQAFNEATVALYRTYGEPRRYKPTVRDALSILLKVPGEEFLFYLENEKQLPPPDRVAAFWDTYTDLQQLEYLTTEDTSARQYRRMISGKVVTGWEAYIGVLKVTHEGYCAFATKSEALHAAEQFQQEQLSKLSQLAKI